MRQQFNLERAGRRSSVVLSKRDMSRSSLIGPPRSANGTLHCMRDIRRLPELELVTQSCSRVGPFLTIVLMCVIAGGLVCPCLCIMHCLQNAAIFIAHSLYRSRPTVTLTSARGLSVVRSGQPAWLKPYPYMASCSNRMKIGARSTRPLGTLVDALA
ncbi:uncharacterized protein LY79DRAFT_550565 [Colletotrichum navitas]|uniref:Uncharacterized protein n=1 Tax=Colletotrichum navitas TaxID=681940 RepID=A0AAD8Q185_9PEZI|nr:uncharacterized protein LY79DRAFT_550565 [Colletotrichum navitas]KAK1594007.1 hypothetical protein LY79DRAFT_550565 [Colletotrichum navitas]